MGSISLYFKIQCFQLGGYILSLRVVEKLIRDKSETRNLRKKVVGVNFYQYMVYIAKQNFTFVFPTVYVIF